MFTCAYMYSYIFDGALRNECNAIMFVVSKYTNVLNDGFFDYKNVHVIKISMMKVISVSKM